MIKDERKDDTEEENKEEEWKKAEKVKIRKEFEMSVEAAREGEEEARK